MCASALRAQGIDVWVMDDTGITDEIRTELNPYGVLVDAVHSNNSLTRRMSGTYAAKSSLAEYPNEA
jgi:hypothetical protein